MIPLARFLQCVRENAARVREYEQGHDGSDGKCDCIGLIIGAVRLAGGTWPGTHGSNWAARNAMSTLNYIDTQYDMFLGGIVYKAKSPGDAGYSLPDRYKDSGDLLDYYHVGVVTSIDPLEITHCTSVPGGIKYDDAIGNWCWGGKLKYVDYDEGGGQMEPIYQAKAKVHADNNYPVKMRAQPSANADVLAKIPQGTIVDVEREESEWSRIQYNGQTGYMMNKFLTPVTDEDREMVTVPRETLEEWEAVMEEMAEAIRDMLGRG